MSQSHEPSVPPVISPQALAQLLQEQPEVRLLDVRTPAEFETAHIPGAYNVPLDTLGEHSREIHATVQQPLVLVCQSGQRARQAEQVLKQAGLPHLHVLEGGVSAWMTSGQSVNPGIGRLSLERQVRIVAGLLAASGGLLALLVNPLFSVLPLFVGGGLAVAGITDRCTMARLLVHLPYNRTSHCDVGSMVAALKAGVPPTWSAPSAGGQH